MELSAVYPATLARLKSWRWDRIIEKHEGPESWGSTLAYADPEFMTIGDRAVLLPIGRDQHPNVTILGMIVSDDQRVLTIFLKDTTYVTDPRDEFFSAGFVAVCERFPDEEFYVAVLYHEWFIIEN